MLKFKEEQGLTLVELLVVIALVAIVAAVALPILSGVLSSASTKAAAVSADEAAKFSSDWSTSGFAVSGDAATGYTATDEAGTVIATIGGTSAGGNGGTGGGGQQQFQPATYTRADLGNGMTGMALTAVYTDGDYSNYNRTSSTGLVNLTFASNGTLFGTTQQQFDALFPIGKTITVTKSGGETVTGTIAAYSIYSSSNQYAGVQVENGNMMGMAFTSLKIVVENLSTPVYGFTNGSEISVAVS